MENLREDEYFNRQQPANGSAFFFGLRRSPDDSEHVLFASNMEGEPVNFIPTRLSIPNLPRDGWVKALAPAAVYTADANQPMTLQDSQGVVFVRKNQD
jgi:hypothetical protein